VSAAALPGPALLAERTPRRALGWGAGLLVLGLGIVGVGGSDEGAPVALAGLLVTIYAIHRLGRLGPDDPAPGDAGEGPPAAVDAIWTGGLAAFAGLAVLVGGLFAEAPGGGRPLLAYVTLLGGAVRVLQGVQARARARQEAARAASRKAKVEKRRRLDKSPAP
jgi:hypothetical protein